MIVLAGDIGGTKADLALATADRDAHNPVVGASLPCRRYASIEEMLEDFLAGKDMRPDRVVLGIAGPVVGGRARLTNLPWAVEESRILRCTGASEVILVNDLEAIASAIPALAPDDLRTVHQQEPEPGGTIAVIAPGTGLGEAFLVWTGTRYRAYPSEGGHVDFAPRNAREGSLLEWLRARYGHVSYERVCSGMAIPDLYRFMREVVGMDADPVVAARVAATDEPTPVIVEAAFGHDVPCPTCHAALEVFVSVLAAEAGNLALKVLATGGVYLAGGMPRRVLSLLERDEFRAAFCDKGQFGALVDRIPVHVVTNPRTGLIGAIRRGVEGE